MKTILSKRQGFSFVEVLTAVTILSFVIVGVLAMTTMNIKVNSFAQHHTKAVQLAEDGLEFLRRVDYNTQLPGLNGVHEDYGTIPNYLEFRRQYNVTWASDISTLQVQISWRSMGRLSAPMTLTTLRASK